MKVFTNAIMVATILECLCLNSGAIAATRSEPIAEDITFYQVPLMCPAARELGCGTRAKPVLLALEKNPVVEQAWLDHTGQMLAVVWTRGSTRTVRTAAVKAVTDAHAISLDELSADARSTAMQGFRSGNGWYRGAEVDRLSDEEARIIADRLLGRVAAKLPAARGKATVLRPVLTKAIREQFVLEPDLAVRRETLMTAARAHLNKTEMSVLREAIDLGFKPVGNER